MRLVFLGTPEFAVPSLEALARSRHEVAGVISQPDRPRGRGRRMEPTPVAAAARRLGLPLVQPEKVGDPEGVEWLEERRPDLGVVVAFGQFIGKRVRDLPPHGTINAHASLLPRHRGAAPVQAAILAGDRTTGVTIMRIAKEMDAGDWCLARETGIGENETAGELSERLAALSAEALLEAAAEIEAGRAVFRPQDGALATLAPKVTRAWSRIEWDRPVDEVSRRIRAATPWPGVDVALRRARFRILGLRVAPDLPAPARPGEIRSLEGRLLVGALDGWIDVLRVQVPGKRPVEAAAFLRGARLEEREEVRPS